MGKRIVVYHQDHCPPCEWAMEFLEKRGLEFTARDVGRDLEAKDELLRLGASSTPTIVVDDAVLEGFREDRLSELLER